MKVGDCCAVFQISTKRIIEDILGEGNLTGKQDYYRPGSIKERADELNELIRNPNIKCIMSDEHVNWEEKTKNKEKRENNWITVFGGKARGRFIGGNLNTMYGIWGSEYMPEIKEGDILFIEDTRIDASMIEKSFSML